MWSGGCGFVARKSSTSAEQYSPPDSEVRVIHGMPELRVSQKVRLGEGVGGGDCCVVMRKGRKE